ncbi:hypothetical protein [Mycobacterium sp.]|uniref:hypothetical protein n=1 Tax=Mycobacterium sp. TaxID=1785 RepID=UPI003A83C5DB
MYFHSDSATVEGDNGQFFRIYSKNNERGGQLFYAKNTTYSFNEEIVAVMGDITAARHKTMLDMVKLLAPEKEVQVQEIIDREREEQKLIDKELKEKE